MPPPRDPITSHVLDQTSGTPAGGIHTTLRLLHPTAKYPSTQPIWTATTSSIDGRINAWTLKNPNSLSQINALEDIISTRKDANGEDLDFQLSFETGAYWRERGQKSFYPRVEVVFKVEREDERGHWHVPVLLGPWGYTTYRGS